MKLRKGKDSISVMAHKRHRTLGPFKSKTEKVSKNHIFQIPNETCRFLKIAYETTSSSC